jgi:hypothetical protein
VRPEVEIAMLVVALSVARRSMPLRPTRMRWPMPRPERDATGDSEAKAKAVEDHLARVKDIGKLA